MRQRQIGRLRSRSSGQTRQNHHRLHRPNPCSNDRARGQGWAQTIRSNLRLIYGSRRDRTWGCPRCSPPLICSDLRDPLAWRPYRLRPRRLSQAPPPAQQACSVKSQAPAPRRAGPLPNHLRTSTARLESLGPLFWHRQRSIWPLRSAAVCRNATARPIRLRTLPRKLLRTGFEHPGYRRNWLCSC